jgi:AraC-like DNA-binding protein
MIPITATFDIRRYGRDVETHAHPHHQIVLPLEGILRMEVAGKAGDVSASKAAIISSGQEHSFVGSPGNAFLVVDVPGETRPGRAARDRIWEASERRPFIALDRGVVGLCAFLVGEVGRVSFKGLRAAVAGDMLLGALERQLGFDEPPLEGPLARAMSFMDAQFDRAVTVEEVARASGVSVSRLHRLFSVRFDSSPQRYMTTCRLRHAARLLENSELSVVEVALKAGYGDQSSFTRAFRREFETTPASYRSAASGEDKRHKIR